MAYLVKRRTLRAGKPNPYAPRQLRRGKWETVARCASLEDATAALRSLQGLYEFAIFHGGHRLEVK